MCDAVKKFAKKYAKEHAKEYAKEVQMGEKTETILAMQKENMPVETIAKCVRLSVDEVNAIINNHLATV